MIQNLLKVVKEGSATVNFPKEVFYNPVQEFNRDLTISVINNFNKNREVKLSKIKNSESRVGLKIFEALSATGLRSVRFAKEIPNVSNIIANDIDPVAADLIRQNVISNGVEDIVEVNCGDANMFMYQSQAQQKKFHVVDLDPYGSASKFLDAAVQIVTNGGLLCVTCTDSAVLCGSATGTSMGKYGSVAIGKLESSHEQGIRILLHAIQSAASRHGLVIKPLISLFVDFYFRVFVQVFDSPALVKSIATKLGMIYFCNGCHTYHIQKLGFEEKLLNNNKKIHCSHGPVVGMNCDICGSKFVIGGPLWTDPIHDVEFCGDLVNDLNENSSSCLGTIKRIIGMTTLAKEELPDEPLYYEIDKIASIIRSYTPSMKEVRSAFLNAGYTVSSTHCSGTSLKTNAPPSVIWDIMRSFLQKSNPEKIERMLQDPGVSCWAKSILKKPNEITVNFQIHEDANPPSRLQKLLRFQQNPMPYWGPKPKARRTDIE